MPFIGSLNSIGYAVIHYSLRGLVKDMNAKDWKAEGLVVRVPDVRVAKDVRDVKTSDAKVGVLVVEALEAEA